MASTRSCAFPTPRSPETAPAFTTAPRRASCNRARTTSSAATPAIRPAMRRPPFRLSEEGAMPYRTPVAAALSAALAVSIAPAQAASVATFVSTKGSDSGNCTPAAPCRTIAFAISVTSARGEIRVLDSGGYGSATTINRGLTIAGGGNSITTPIVIDAAGHTVVLRDLVLDGRGVSNVNGVRIINGTVVHIEHCVVEHFKQTGISSLVEGTVAVTLTDSTVRNNG